MAYEDLTTYTEVDPNSKITLTGTAQVNASIDANEDGYLYKDFGANFFDALDVDFESFHHWFSGAGGSNTTGGIAFANSLAGIEGFASTDMSMVVGAFTTADQTHPYLVRGNYVATDGDGSRVMNSDTLFYWTVTRPPGSDTVTAKVYSDSARTTLVHTWTLSGFGSVKWRYCYAFAHRNTGSTPRIWESYLKNLRVESIVTPSTKALNLLTFAPTIVIPSAAFIPKVFFF